MSDQPELHRFGKRTLMRLGAMQPEGAKGVKGTTQVWRDVTHQATFANSKYKPHQGKQERARRLRQAQRGRADGHPPAGELVHWCGSNWPRGQRLRPPMVWLVLRQFITSCSLLLGQVLAGRGLGHRLVLALFSRLVHSLALTESV
jgi:hypothetical protein